MERFDNQDNPFLALFIEEWKARPKVEAEMQKNRARIDAIEKRINGLICFAAGLGLLNLKDLLKFFGF